MDRADIAGMSNALREAFLAAGNEIEEKRTATGSAFFTGGHAIGQFETRSTLLRARLWLTDKERQKLEARPTFDGDSGWLHVVSDQDVAFLRGLLAGAYRSASSGTAAPSAPRPAAGAVAPWTVAAPSERRRVTPPVVADKLGEKKKGAPRRPPSRI
jgi:hypothetical protein